MTLPLHLLTLIFRKPFLFDYKKQKSHNFEISLYQLRHKLRYESTTFPPDKRFICKKFYIFALLNYGILMLVDFNTLEDTARVWIYPANRVLTSEELSKITTDLSEYLSTWASHGKSVRCAFQIRYDRFIVIAADENQHIGGCTLDELAHFIQDLERKHHLLLLDKMNVSYRHEDEIYYVPLVDFKKLAQQKKVDNQTIVFNNLVTNLYEYQHAWETPMEHSWHNRFLK